MGVDDLIDYIVTFWQLGAEVLDLKVWNRGQGMVKVLDCRPNHYVLCWWIVPGYHVISDFFPLVFTKFFKKIGYTWKFEMLMIKRSNIESLLQGFIAKTLERRGKKTSSFHLACISSA